MGNTRKVKLYVLLIFLYPSFLNTHGLSTSNSMPDGFVDLKSIIPTIELELRYFNSHNFIGQKIEGYEQPRCLLSRKAAEALRKVQEELLPFSLSLKIYDAYRPQSAVDHFVSWAKDLSDTLMKKEFYPRVEKKYLFKEGYISAKSGHSRGSTVDLTIVPLPLPDQELYQSGDSLCECFKPLSERFKDNSLDMGSGYDCFDPVSHTVNTDLNHHQRVNRLLLKTIMGKYGFRGSTKEWWHFTLKNEPYPDTYFNFPIQ